MKSRFPILIAILLCTFAAQAQAKYDLPKDATIIEQKAVTPARALVLWIQNPKKNPRDSSEDIYSCPEYTSGNFYSGSSNISLVNSKTGKIINSIDLHDAENDNIAIPYMIQRFYYKVPAITKEKEGKPEILFLQDFNGDGKAYEFAMYEAQACMGLDTTLYGYSEKQDKVIQYPVKLNSQGKQETLYWVDYLFSKKPVKPGYWKYEIDYRGRGGSLDKYEFRYDKTNEEFIGSLESTPSEK